LKMKVCLINPAEGVESYSSPPLGLAFISSYLKKQGVEVKGFDFCLLDKPIDDIITEIIDYKPDVIGISVTTPYYISAVNIANRIKARSNIPIVFGGIHASLLPEECIKNDSVDYVIAGEAERSFYKRIGIAEHLSVSFDWKQIQIRWRDIV